MTALAVRDRPDAAMMEQVIVAGDLSAMPPAQRVDYYGHLCRSLGLNPLSKPFDYIRLNGKLTLYARKDAADQLRKLNGVSITRLDQQVAEGVCIVTVYAQTRDGRVDSDIGAVSVQGLSGEAKANAMMKAITKAKRRVTLSICGLGFLDETEIDSIPTAQPATVNLETGEIVDAPASNGHPPAHNLPPDWDALADVVNEQLPPSARYTNSWHLRQAIASELNTENASKEGYKPVDGKKLPYPSKPENIQRIIDRALAYARAKISTLASLVPDYEPGDDDELETPF